MNDMLLTGYLQTQNFASNMADRAVRAAKGENGDIVQTVIIIGIFVIICVLIGGLITGAMKKQGATLSNCISKVNTSAGCSTFK